MFPILVYLFAIYVVSAAVFGLELYAIERNEAPVESELWVTAKEDVADSTAEPTHAELPPATDESEIIKPDVTRRKRKKLIRRLHKLSSQ